MLVVLQIKYERLSCLKTLETKKKTTTQQALSRQSAGVGSVGLPLASPSKQAMTIVTIVKEEGAAAAAPTLTSLLWVVTLSARSLSFSED